MGKEKRRNLTEDEKKLVCNGVGPRGFLEKIIPETIFGLNITEPANIHDWMYNKGKTKKDKIEADIIFLDNMLRTIDNAGGNFLIKLLRTIRAATYYRFVRDFGDQAFRKKDKI